MADIASDNRWTCADLCCGALNEPAAVACVACGYRRPALARDWSERVTRGLERQSSFAGGLVGGGEALVSYAPGVMISTPVSHEPEWLGVADAAACPLCGWTACRCEIRVTVAPSETAPGATLNYEPEWIETRGPSAHGAG